jgi:peptidoglycan hydrolase CwlO-like protein
MKNLFTLAIAFFLTTVSFAQLTRPEKIDDENIDKFVNSSFDLYEKKNGYTKDLETLTARITALEASTKKIEDSVITKTDNKLKKVEDGYKNIQTELETLTGQSEDMVNKATDISPKTKVIKATKSVKSAVSAVNQTRDGLIPDMKSAAALRARFEKLKTLNLTK